MTLLGRWRFVTPTSGTELASRLEFLLVTAKLVNGLFDLSPSYHIGPGFLSGVVYLIPALGRIPLESFGVERTQDIPLRVSGRAEFGAGWSSSAAVNFKTNLAVRFENSSMWQQSQ